VDPRKQTRRYDVLNLPLDLRRLAMVALATAGRAEWQAQRLQRELARFRALVGCLDADYKHIPDKDLLFFAVGLETIISAKTWRYVSDLLRALLPLAALGVLVLALLEPPRPVLPEPDRSPPRPPPIIATPAIQQNAPNAL